MSYKAYIDEKIIDERIFNRWNSEYIRCGDYTKIENKIRIRHTTCNNEFDMYIHSLLSHKSIPCPYCNPNSIKNTDIFKFQLYKKFGEEFSVIGEYTGSLKHIKIKHNECGTIWEPSASGLLRGAEKCPYCANVSGMINTEVFKHKVKDLYGNEYKVIGNYEHSQKPILIRHICGYEYNVYPTHFLSGSYLCPICNDYVKLNTQSYKKLLERKYNYRFALLGEYQNSSSKVKLRCNDCGEEFELNAYHVLKNIACCPKCDKGISYPEKFFRSIFEQLGIEYIPEYSCKYARWCKKYRYDFYLPYFDMIIEVHGKQHYEYNCWNDLDKIKENDNDKQLLAVSNVSHYIIIDARESSVNWIKRSIYNSDLIKYVDFNNVDWEKAHNDSLSSINSKIYVLYKQNFSTKDIAEKLNISLATVERYIKRYKDINK